MLERKENFKCYGIKTRPTKNRQVLYSYKKLFSKNIDQNFSVSSYKNLLYSCHIDIVAKCGVDNQQLGTLKGTSAVGASWRYVAANNANIKNFTRQGKRNI